MQARCVPQRQHHRPGESQHEWAIDSINTSHQQTSNRTSCLTWTVKSRSLIVLLFMILMATATPVSLCLAYLTLRPATDQPRATQPQTPTNVQIRNKPPCQSPHVHRPHAPTAVHTHTRPNGGDRRVAPHPPSPPTHPAARPARTPTAGAHAVGAALARRIAAALSALPAKPAVDPPHPPPPGSPANVLAKLANPERVVEHVIPHRRRHVHVGEHVGRRH